MHGMQKVQIVIWHVGGRTGPGRGRAGTSTREALQARGCICRSRAGSGGHGLGADGSSLPRSQGSTAVFYSDGLVENRVRGLDAGLDELVRVAASASEDLLRAPGRLLQYLLDHMLAGQEQDDDFTVLIVQRL
jgi:hypothetical protein